MRRSNDPVLDTPLLSPDELKNWPVEVEAVWKGESRSFVGTHYWHRVMAEIARRQANSQISAARSLVHATIALVVVTLVLIAVNAVPIVIDHRAALARLVHLQ